LEDRAPRLIEHGAADGDPVALCLGAALHPTQHRLWNQRRTYGAGRWDDRGAV